MEVKLSIPESLSEITVGQYMEWMKVVAQADWTPIREKMITVSIFCRASVDEVEGLSINDLNEVYKDLKGLLDGAFNSGLKKKIKIGGKSFGFHPDLPNMSTGEWVDLEEALQEAGEVFNAIPDLLSILYRPIVPKRWYNVFRRGYKIEKYSVKHIENAELMKEVDMETASGVAVFFWTSGLQSAESFIASMTEGQDLTKMNLN